MIIHRHMTYTAHHVPSGEDWLVLRIEGSRAYIAGWPPTIANVVDLTDIKENRPATLEETEYLHSEFGLSI